MSEIEDILLELYNNENISIGIHGTAVLPDEEQKFAKSVLENGLMCRFNDIRRTVAFQDRGKIHAHGNIDFKQLTSYNYQKQEFGYIHKEQRNGKIIQYISQEVNLEQCSFVVAIPKELSTTDNEIFSGPMQKFDREYAYSSTELSVGNYKNNVGRPINPKYIVGYFMNGDISTFTYNNKFFGFDFDSMNKPHVSNIKIQEENERIRKIKEQRLVKQTQELAIETIEEQKDTQAKTKIHRFIKHLLDKFRDKKNVRGIN